MKFTIISLFPQELEHYLSATILGRAQKQGTIEVELVDLRKFGLGSHSQVDDTPYGGGAGMVLRADVVVPAIEAAKNSDKSAKIILLSPAGKQYTQKVAEAYSKDKHIILVAGRFEGFDERIKKYVDEVVSIGPYVLAGGELAALAIVESVARLVPGVLGNPASAQDESFNNDSLEYPQYTKPADFRSVQVPEVLVSGNHQDIALWRQAHKKKI